MKKLEKEVSEKTNEPVSEKTYGQTEGRTDPIIGPFGPRPGVQKTKKRREALNDTSYDHLLLQLPFSVSDLLSNFMK